MKAEILALLEEGPYRPAELAQWLNEDAVSIVRRLKLLAREGLVERCDRGARVVWRLRSNGHVSPAPARAKSGKALRQPAEPRGSMTIEPGTPPSWWVGLDRAAFGAAAHGQRDR